MTTVFSNGSKNSSSFANNSPNSASFTNGARGTGGTKTLGETVIDDVQTDTFETYIDTLTEGHKPYKDLTFNSRKLGWQNQEKS